MWFNWVKVGMYALLLLLLLFNCGCCCCCFYMFVHVRANDWVKLKVRLLSAPGAQIVSMCTMCAHVCVWIAQKSGSHKQNQCCSHTHTLAYVAGTLTPMWTHVAWLLLVVCTLLPGWWLYSPARNDRNVLKWDNCCFDWLHYYCCCLIFFLFAFLLFAKNHLCLYVDFFFVVYIYFFLLLLIIFFVHFYISCIYGRYLCVDISFSCWHTLTHTFALFYPLRVQALELLLIFNPF